MKIFLGTKTSAKFATLVATQFIHEVQAQTSLAGLYAMGQDPYFTNLHNQIAGESVEFLVNRYRGQDPEVVNSPNLWCGGHKKKCQQAFADKLVELTVADHEILLAILTLRPKAWGKIHYHEEDVDGEKVWIAKYHDWSTSTIEIVEYVRPFLSQISNPTENVRVFWGNVDHSVHTMRREMWEQYALELRFGEAIRSATGLALAKKLASFTACKLVYTTAHTGDIGALLFKQMCEKAKETEELIFVVNSLFNQGEKGPLWKKLKPLLRKLITSIK